MLKLDFKQQLGALGLEVSVEVPANGITAVFGLSGAGKTSLINAVSGLTKPDSGVIMLNDRTLVDCGRGVFIPPEKRRIGYVFQEARLFPHYSIRGNLQYGMKAQMRGQFDSIVELLGIGHLLKRFPMTLSGGEKQRVAIGRALLTAPELLLMDEPLASLDVPRKRELIPYLERLAKDVNIPILYVTHSMEEILRLAEQVIVLDAGKVRASGELEAVWASDAMLPWLQQEEQSSVWSVTLSRQHNVYPMSALALGDYHLWVNRLDVPTGQRVRVRISAADVSLTLSLPEHSSIRNILPAEVVELHPYDDRVEVKLIVGQHFLWARITPWARDELGIAIGQRLFAQIKSVSISREVW
ncbi:molybdenum import ATP-binding protein ModC [Leminorella grimontii]|uniref:Molybdenum import ATP-binding protein ModC n=1 Tax=Leminorella grimontii TaxID=82981 RepID=A0AAV5MWU8_9GAMM|nr:molybdenum ABC transporter ATP-binding protein ModC [Leminorella grimontii]KFC96507.1 ATP-binding component of an ABC superfamily molybdenum transporter [Leminorella grimontii ATCC 33999 = DSM 5078]GKX54296.1 molybdenum import ATP-binding protein ModC [Leminorella grimontii]VFS59579.1 Sulfate/thiosulfate import ATP-binding protein CysA [Leminorella grimontii]